MAWVICLVSVSRRTMSGARAPSRASGPGRPPRAWSGVLDFAPGGLDRGGQRVDHLVGAGRRPGRGRGCAAGAARRPGRSRLPGRRPRACLMRAAAIFLAGLGTIPVRVVQGGGVGVQGEPGAGVAEVVLLPPPRRSCASTPPRAARSSREVSTWICRVAAPARAGHQPGDLPQR